MHLAEMNTSMSSKSYLASPNATIDSLSSRVDPHFGCDVSHLDRDARGSTGYPGFGIILVRD